MPQPATAIRGIVPFALAAAIALGAAAVPPGTAAGEDDPDDAKAARGEPLFEVYCTSCHGPRGRGDGPVAPELGTEPADLTRIAERNGGEFPFEEVRRKIDGRQDVSEHNPRQMPLWGIALQEWDRDTDQEAEVRRRIELLTHYLASIQGSGD